MTEREFYFNFFPQLYEAMKKDGKGPECRNIVKNFLLTSYSIDLEKKIDGFLEIPSISFAPADEEYFKLYDQLMQLYTNRFYYSTIVLAGVLCERICYDILAKQEIKLGTDKILSSEQKAHLFEMNITRLIPLLKDWGLIKEGTRKEMLKVNNKRNEYVHPKTSKKDLHKDALEMIKRITTIIKNELALEALPKVVSDV